MTADQPSEKSPVVPDPHQSQARITLRERLGAIGRGILAPLAPANRPLGLLGSIIFFLAPGAKLVAWAAEQLLGELFTTSLPRILDVLGPWVPMVIGGALLLWCYGTAWIRYGSLDMFREPVTVAKREYRGWIVVVLLGVGSSVVVVPADYLAPAELVVALDRMFLPLDTPVSGFTGMALTMGPGGLAMRPITTQTVAVYDLYLENQGNVSTTVDSATITIEPNGGGTLVLDNCLGAPTALGPLILVEGDSVAAFVPPWMVAIGALAEAGRARQVMLACVIPPATMPDVIAPNTRHVVRVWDAAGRDTTGFFIPPEYVARPLRTSWIAARADSVKPEPGSSG